MKPLLWLPLLALVAAPAASAQNAVARDDHALATTRTLEHAASHRAPAPHAGQFAYALGEGFGGENGPYANPYRTYPPSCMADPLPITPTGPIWSRTMDMASYAYNLGGWVREPVTITVWRMPCSSSTGLHAITLLRVQRQASHEGDTTQYVGFPGVRVAQGDIRFDDINGFDLPRIASEPNTIVSMTPVDSAMFDSTTFVLEDYPLSDRPAFDYTKAFSLRFDNFIDDGRPRQYVIDVPAYAPTAATYPDAGEPLPITGYMTTNWYDPTHSGEGMMVQVFEVQSTGKLALQFNWFTYGPDGRPFWVSGDAHFDPGSRQVTVPAGYRDGGGFAGDFGAGTMAHVWGTVNFQFNDCNHMQFSYQSNTGLPGFVPQGSGTRVWSRLANGNGITCE